MSNIKLARSNDRKVTNAVTKSGNVAIANAFGLPSGAAFSCVAQTAFCALICYAGKLVMVRKAVAAVLLRNWELLKDASRAEMIDMLSDMIKEFEAECEKRSAPKLFRIHWDGDFFSTEYMIAWSKVVAAFPDTQFWVYTRVPAAAVYLHKQRHPNLSLYFSGDRDNLETAKYLATQGINVAYVEETFDQGKAEFPKATRCPENNSRKLDDGTQSFPLINADGSACARCGLCINGRKSVLFATKKR